MGDQVGKGGVLSRMLSRWRIWKALPYLNGRVLDFGCGRGNLAPLVAPRDYVGVDRSGESLLIARGLYPGHQFLPGIPADGAFDSIAMLAVLEHIPDAAGVLRTLAGVLSKDGRIVLTTPHPASTWIHAVGSRIGLFSRDAHEEHFRMYDRHLIESLVKNAELHMLSYDRFMLGLNQLAVICHKCK